MNTYTTSYQSTPSVASDPAGNFVVVWASLYHPEEGIFGQRYDSDGTPLGSEFQVNTNTRSARDSPEVAAAASGDFVVVWATGEVFGQRYDSDGNPLGAEFQVNTYTTDFPGSPAVASDASGNFVVVWHRTTERLFDKGIFGQRYDSDGNRLGGEFQVSLGHGEYVYGHHPDVAADPTGNFVIVWASYPTVLGRRYDSNGNALGGVFSVSTYDDSGDPSVATDSSGNFVVVWRARGGSEYDIFGSRYDSDGNPLDGAFKVNTYTTSSQQYPSVASNPAGNFVVVWGSEGPDGSRYGVFGQRYDSSGTPLGGEFQVNAYTTDDQQKPSVASDASGNFVVTWESDDQDGSYDGVFGQRFSAGVSDGCRSTVRNPTSLCPANPQ